MQFNNTEEATVLPMFWLFFGILGGRLRLTPRLLSSGACAVDNLLLGMWVTPLHGMGYHSCD